MKILAASYLLPIASDPITEGAILIDRDKIIDTGKLSLLKEKYPEAGIEDFGEAAILPGFINAHSHLELTAFRNFLDDVEHEFFSWLIKLTNAREKLSKEDIEFSALLGCYEGIRAGITCFADIGRFGFAGFNALKKSGLRGILFQETEFSPDNSSAHDDFEKLSDKFYALRSEETALVRAGLSPHSPYTVSSALFKKISDISMRENIKLSIHAAESEMEDELLISGKGKFADIFASQGLSWNSPGVSPIRFLNDLGVLEARPLLAHCIRVNDMDMDMIASSGSSIAHCPKSNAKFGHGIAPFERFLEKSITTGIGSDSVASNNICDILEEARFASFFARARESKNGLIDSKSIIHAATLGGAEALGTGKETGSLEAGKQADLIAIKIDEISQMPNFNIYDTLLFATSSRQNILTMVAGEVLLKDGEFLGIDESELKAKLKEISAKL